MTIALLEQLINSLTACADFTFTKLEQRLHELFQYNEAG